MLMLVLLMVFVYTWETFTYRHNDREYGKNWVLLFGCFQQGKLKEIVAMKQNSTSV
jgi:hypothetical protein